MRTADLVATGSGHTLAVISLSHRGGKIDHVWAVRNPEKTRSLESSGRRSASDEYRPF